MKTRTGSYSIGFRRGGGEWQKDLDGLIEWAKTSDLQVIDLGKDGDKSARTVIDAGLQVGSVDLAYWQEMISADKGQRAEAIAGNSQYIRDCAAAGVTTHFLVMLPADPALPRRENFGYMVESFGELSAVLEENGARLVIEGWPGPGALCCTPEAYRAFFDQCPSPAMGVNYDPSHLIRMGIDPLRFLEEFGGRVYHMHGKDTQFLTENFYEFGTEQPATFAKPIRYGAHTWRYTIPGHGVMRWTEALEQLETAGYTGYVCIELEDANFMGAAAGEQLGILQGARFLTGC